MYCRHLWEVHVAHSALSINLSILGMTARATSVSPWHHWQENNTDRMKIFWVHWLLGFRALPDRHQISATVPWVPGTEEQRWCRLEKGWTTFVDVPWTASGKRELETQVSLQCKGGRSNVHFSSHCEGQTKDWRDGVVEVVVRECCLLLVRRFKELRFQKEIRDLGCEGQYQKRENNLSFSPGTLCQVKGHNDTCTKVRTV